MSRSRDLQDHANNPRHFAVAKGTINAIHDGCVYFKDSNLRLTKHNIRQSIDDTIRRTEYFKPDSNQLKWWKQRPPPGVAGVAAERLDNQSGSAVQIVEMSTLQGAHSFSQKRPAPKIGVLNFASATMLGGEFINGASAQEESIARSSALYASLRTPQAKPFYEIHELDKKGGYYSHAMIYSPSVAIFRDDAGNWLRPYHVDIVTSPAVNADLVRKLSGSRSDTEGRILSVMKERMGRMLALFEQSRIRNLVLGSFGTGIFEDDVGSLAKICGELLGAPGARFANSFDQVMFAIPDGNTRQKFRDMFEITTKESRM